MSSTSISTPGSYRLNAITEAIAKPAIVLTASQCVLAANSQASSLLSCSQENLLETSLDEILTDGQHPLPFKTDILADYLTEKGDFKAELSLTTVEDEVVPVMANISLIDAPDWSASYLFTFEELYSKQAPLEPIRQERNNYRELFENSGEALLLLDPESGRILDNNRRARDLFGYETEGLTDRKLDTLGSEECEKSLSDHIEQTLRSGPRTFEWKAARKDGNGFWAELRLSSVTIYYHTKILVSARNITEQRRNREKIEERERRFRQLFHSTMHALVLVDSDGTIELINEKAQELFGYDSSELQGQEIETLVPPAKRFEHRSLREDYLKTPEKRQMSELRDIHAVDRNGRKIPVEIGLGPITIDGDRKILADITNVSQRREAEQELRSSKERLEAILETTNDGFWEANEDGEITNCNQAFADLLLMDPEDVTELTVPDIEAIENSDEFKQHQQAIMRDGYDRFETKLRTASGSTIDVRMTVNYMEDWESFICFTRDISERKKYKERLEELTETTDDVLWMIDAEWENVLFVNSAYESVFGRSLEELRADPTSYLESVHPEDREGVESAMRRLKNGNPIDIEYRVNESEDYGRWVWVNGQPIAEEGEVVRIVGVVRDITERKQFREELKRSNQELKNFGNAVTHDLKQPLRTITSYLELLDKRFGERLPDKARHYIDRTVEGTHRMKELMDQLKEYSSVNFAAIDREPVDLQTVLETVLETCEIRLEKEKARVEYDDLPVVFGDYSLLEDLFRNLVENALRYRDEEPPRVTITSHTMANRVVIQVSDNGIGIPEEYQDRIFKVFERLHTDDEKSGSGIGLAICKKIVNLHNGDIDVDSTPGEGTTFIVELPRHIDQTSSSEGIE